MQISAIEGNGQMLDGGAMFGNAPREVWSQWMPADERGRIALACRSLLVQAHGKTILCEVGVGAFFEPKLSERFGITNPEQHMLLENLKAKQIDVDQVDYVILSHLHFDHAGGLLPPYQWVKQGQTAPVFKNAQILVSERALQRAQNPHSRDRASFIPVVMDSLLQSGQMSVVKDDQSTVSELPFLEFYYTDGHTPGQMHTLIHGQDKTVVFCGDLIPGVPWVHVPITMGYDRFPELLIEEKQNLYQIFEGRELYLFFTHDPKVCMGRLQREKDPSGRIRYSVDQKWENLKDYSL